MSFLHAGGQELQEGGSGGQSQEQERRREGVAPQEEAGGLKAP